MPRSRHDFAQQIKCNVRREQRNQKNTSAGITVRDMGAARMLALAIVCVLSLPCISRAQQVKLKAALQVPISDLFSAIWTRPPTSARG
jgi:hypothetical protein